jgi:dTMP kinase
MVKNNSNGLFIALEGLDGSGSTIQASLLYSVLKKEGYRAYYTKEPTNYLIGGLIKGSLAGEWETNAEALQLLFAADRAHHLQKEIIPKLEAGRIVISDRYAFSSIAYGSLDIKDKTWLENINDSFILPDLTFIIKVRPKVCAMRLKEGHYDLELFKEEEKLARVWQAYEEIVKDYKNIFIIDGEREEIEIIKEIVDIVKKAINKS